MTKIAMLKATEVGMEAVVPSGPWPVCAICNVLPAVIAVCKVNPRDHRDVLPLCCLCGVDEQKKEPSRLWAWLGEARS